MKFYDPKKTFFELVADYKGDLDDAYNEFEDAWSSSNDDRTLQEAMGISNDEDFTKFELFELTLEDLLKKYAKRSAAQLLLP